MSFEFEISYTRQSGHSSDPMKDRNHPAGAKHSGSASRVWTPYTTPFVQNLFSTDAKLNRVAAIFFAGLTIATGLTLLSVGTAIAKCISLTLFFVGGSLCWSLTKLKDYSDASKLYEYKTNAEKQSLPKIIEEHGWNNLTSYQLISNELLQKKVDDFLSTCSYSQIVLFTQEIKAQSNRNHFQTCFNCPKFIVVEERLQKDCIETNGKILDEIPSHVINYLIDNQIIGCEWGKIKEEYNSLKKDLERQKETIKKKFLDTVWEQVQPIFNINVQSMTPREKFLVSDFNWKLEQLKIAKDLREWAQFYPQIVNLKKDVFDANCSDPYADFQVQLANLAGFIQQTLDLQNAEIKELEENFIEKKIPELLATVISSPEVD